MPSEALVSCGLDHPFTVSRWSGTQVLPSSIYNFPAQALAWSPIFICEIA